MLLTRATSNASVDEQEFSALRKTLMESPWAKLAPSFLRTYRTTGEFWHHIKEKFKTYDERREYLRAQFDGLLTALEQMPSPVDASTTTITAITSEYVHEMWTKALERRSTDPEGAITASRTLLEAVCKHILEDLGVAYGPAVDLPALYSLVAKSLSLAPSQHTEGVFKQILGGCHSVVEGLGALRNRVSDAHGQGQRPVRPGARHAELAVNLAGSMATFLLATHEERRSAQTLVT
jgi:hypothetical protein